MDKKQVKRYKLVLLSTTYRDREIYTDEHGNNKFTLTEIDAMTTDYDNPNQFVTASRLNPACDRLDIAYQAKSQTRHLTAVFSKDEFLKRLSHDNIGKYQVNQDYYFIKNAEKICLKIIRNKQLMKYLIDYNYISGNPLKNDFENFLYSYSGYRNEYNYALRRLLNKLGHYKTIRGLVVGIRNYEEMREIIDLENPLSTPYIEPEIKKPKPLPDLTKENYVQAPLKEEYTQGTLFDLKPVQKTKKRI